MSDHIILQEEVSEAYTYIMDKLEETDKNTVLVTAPQFYLAYQELMHLFVIKDSNENSNYVLEVPARMAHLEEKLFPKEISACIYLNNFWKMGASLDKLEGEENRKIFFEIKKRRDELLQQEKSFISFLIIQKGFETEDVYRNYYARMLRIMSSKDGDNDEEQLVIELKSGIKHTDILQAAKEFYEPQGFLLDDVFIKDKETNRTVKFLTMSFSQPGSGTLAMLISVSDLEKIKSKKK